jgi:hypothetical protein
MRFHSCATVHVVAAALVLLVAASAQAQCLEDDKRKPECDQSRCISLEDRAHAACEMLQRCIGSGLKKKELERRLEIDQKCVRFETDVQECFIEPDEERTKRISGLQEFVDECIGAISNVGKKKR